MSDSFVVVLFWSNQPDPIRRIEQDDTLSICRARARPEDEILSGDASCFH